MAPLEIALEIGGKDRAQHARHFFEFSRHFSRSIFGNNCLAAIHCILKHVFNAIVVSAGQLNVVRWAHDRLHGWLCLNRGRTHDLARGGHASQAGADV